jgi:hypothetical protein
MLLTQATALQALFSHLTVKALTERNTLYRQQLLALALKAQAQSRATLTALADIKLPRSANFIGQQNVAVSQQVNNQSASPLVGVEAPSKLLEIPDGERLDDRKTDAAGDADQAMAALGERNRAKDTGG